MSWRKAKIAAGALACYQGYRTLFPVRAKSVNGKLVLLTGAATGLGRELALELARLGARLVLWDVQGDALAETERMILEECPNTLVTCQLCNLRQREEIGALADRLLESGEKVDIIINNAGIVTGKYFPDLSEDHIEAVMQVNALAHMYIVRKFLPQMIERNTGHIVTVSSVAGLIASPSMVDYSASKFAARGFIEGLRLELLARGIWGVKCSCICPTLIDTGLFKGFYVLGNPTLKPSQVVRSVIDAIEYEHEFVVVPGWLKINTVVFKGMALFAGYLGLPIPDPMASFDNTKSLATFQAMQAHSKL